MWNIAALCVTVSLVMAQTWSVKSQAEVYLEFRGQQLTNDSIICLTDIGEQPSSSSVPDNERGDALVCVTNRANCCRGADGTPGGVGEWTINGNQVDGSNIMPLPSFYRNRGTGLVRLNRQPSSTRETVGPYCCLISGLPTVCVNVQLNDDICTANRSPPTSPRPETTTDSNEEATVSTPDPFTHSHSTNHPQAVVCESVPMTIYILGGTVALLCIIIIALLPALAVALCKLKLIRSQIHKMTSNSSKENAGKIAPTTLKTIVVKTNQAYMGINPLAQIEDSDYENVCDIPSSRSNQTMNDKYSSTVKQEHTYDDIVPMPHQTVTA